MKDWIVIIAVGLVSIGATRVLWPRTVERVVPGPPARAETVLVEDTIFEIDTVFDVREVFSTDTVNLVDTVVVGDTVRVACGEFVPKRTYVRDVEVGEELGEDTWVRGVEFSADEEGLQFRPFTKSVWTAGMLRGLEARPDGVALDFTPFPETKSCSFWDHLPYIAGSAGGGVLIGAIFH